VKNASGWALSHSEEFVAATESFFARIEKGLRSGPAEGEVERLLREKDALQDFIRAAVALQNGERDPAHLPQACDADGTPIAHYYVLRVGPWRGFYWIGHLAKACVGVLALHDSHDLSGTLKKALQEALGKVP
jgi:hypothetical protein